MEPLKLKRISYPVNENGHPLGEWRSGTTKLSDAQVIRMRELYENQDPADATSLHPSGKRWSYSLLAVHFAVSKSLAQHICTYYRRNVEPSLYKTGYVDPLTGKRVSSRILKRRTSL